MKNKILLLSLVLLLLPFVKAYDLQINANLTIPYSTNYTFNYTCCYNISNSSNCSTNTIVKLLNFSVPYQINKTFVLNQSNDYSVNSTDYKIFLKNKDSAQDFNIKLSGLNNSNILNINFLTSFEQPEKVIINSSLFNTLTFFVKNNVSYQIPTKLSSNKTIYNISFYLPEFNKTINKTISFKDTKPPVITVYKLFNQMTVGGKYLIRVFYSDESLLGKINYSSNSNLLVNVIKKPDYVDFLITPQEYGITDFNISLSDKYNNTINKSFSFVVSPEGNFYLHDLNIPRLLVGKDHVFDLYKGKMMNFNITLINESFSNNKTPIVWVKTGSSQVQLPLNSTQHVLADSLSFMISSNYKGDFDCTLKFDYPKRISGSHYFHFHTTFANYTLLPEENLTIHGVTTTCKLIEKPNFEDSRVVCSVNLPYDTVSEDTLMIVPKRDFDWYQTMMQDRINNWKEKFKNQLFLKNLVLIILGVVLLSGFVWITKPDYFIGGR